MLINRFVQEGSESQYKFSEVNHFVIVGVKYTEEIPCIDAILQINRLSEFFVVDDTIILLCLAELVKEQIEIIDFFRGEC